MKNWKIDDKGNVKEEKASRLYNFGLFFIWALCTAGVFYYLINEALKLMSN